MKNRDSYLKTLELYKKHVSVREENEIPPLPLNPLQTEAVCGLLELNNNENSPWLTDLLINRVSPGVDPSAEIKADFLSKIIDGKIRTELISPDKAIEILGTMLGGYNVNYLIKALQNNKYSVKAAAALKDIILIYEDFEKILNLSKNSSEAESVISSWAEAEWFTKKESLPESVKVKVFKVSGEINTDDFSPAGDAWSRPDIPLHSLSMGRKRFPDGIETIKKWREEGYKVAFAGDVVGTGSSRKSACNSLLWHIGSDIPYIPNKRRGGIVLGNVIAPIFFNTMEDSGGLPIITDVSALSTGDIVTINLKKGLITTSDNESRELAKFDLTPSNIEDEFKAGGRIPLIIGKALTIRARKTLKRADKSSAFIPITNPEPKTGQKYTLAQKIVGKACGLPGVLPNRSCEPVMTTVASQDTTGPMTADELKELACLRFQSPMYMQSFCHTAAYPRPVDVKMHKSLSEFTVERNGLALKPGDGVIHTWVNRLLLPDTVGTGGDSHTRFPLGISFPAGSGLVAFAGALGFMPLDMPESVLVKFSGKLNPGITLRDVVNSIPYFAIKKGLLTVSKENKKNIFNGRILEVEGLEDITVEQAFELMDATAERSAAAGAIKLSEKSVSDYLRSNIALINRMIEDGYESKETLESREKEMEKWLKNPSLMSADPGADYAAVLEINLGEIHEPIVCCPNDPDNVKLLSEIAGTKIEDVFLGSCMTNIGHFRAAGKIWKDSKRNPDVRVYVVPPTRMDQKKLKEEGYFSLFNLQGSRIEVPGCSICMGNQLRVPDKSIVYSSSTRNFDNRMGNGAKVYLGSAELGAMIALTGLIPTPDEYQKIYNEKIEPFAEEIYNYLQFDDEY